MGSAANPTAPRPVVLVVEDEPLQRMMAMDLVESAGFDAVAAINADQAIAILEKRLDIRIVFTDIDLPGTMDGMRLAAFIRGRWPPIDFIITSGHIQATAEMMPERSQFFGKPYQRQKIVQALQSFRQELL